MADVGLIALDPARLSGLEVHLQSLADGCRRRAARVAEAVAGAGLDAHHPVAELERLAAVCRRERDEVAMRRAMVEALPDDLPLPPRTFPTAGATHDAGRALADAVIAALAAHPPRWSRLARLVAQLDRSSTPLFAASFFAALGPVRARQLPLVLEQAWRRSRDAEDVPVEAGAARVVEVQLLLTDALRAASRVRGSSALGDRWYRSYAGLPPGDAAAAAEGAATDDERDEVRRVERSLRDLGYGVGMAASVAQAVGWRRAAVALQADRGLIGLVAAPLALADGDGIACDGPEAVLRTAAAGVSVVGAVVPGAGVPAALAAGVLSALAVVFDACAPQPPRTGGTRRTADPTTGESRLPSGHQSNPHVDTAGVPLSPAYG